jgi:hypothetical protein
MRKGIENGCNFSLSVPGTTSISGKISIIVASPNRTIRDFANVRAIADHLRFTVISVAGCNWDGKADWLWSGGILDLCRGGGFLVMRMKAEYIEGDKARENFYRPRLA